MNKKGFSLIELLLVIVIIAIITLLVLPNMMDIISTGKNKKWTTIETVLSTNLELYNIDYLEDVWNYGCVEDENTVEIECPTNSRNNFEVSIDDLLEVNPDINLDNCEVTYLNIVKKSSSNEFEYQTCIECGDEYKSNYAYCDRTTPASCFEYSTSENNATITGYDASCGTDVVIPEKLNGYSVTAIKDGTSTTGVFVGKDLTSIVFPDTLITIGDYAFYNNTNLTGNLEIPYGVQIIGNSAFANNNFTSVTFPNSVTSIESDAFENNNLTNIVIPSSVTYLSGFNNNNLTSIEIPDSVETIGAFAFADNQNLTGILKIPDSVTSIGWSSFNNCNFNGLILGEKVKTIGTSAFSKNYNLTGHLVIPDSVTAIELGAFANNNFTSLTLGNNVKTIESMAFYQNYNLTGHLVIPDSVTKIGSSAFTYNNFTSLTLGNNVKTIEDQAFRFNSELTGELVIPDSVETIGHKVFQNCHITSLILGNSVKTIGNGAFKSNLVLTGNLYIPDSVTSIGMEAFSNNNLTNVIIGENSSLTEVTGIGSGVFSSSNRVSTKVLSDGTVVPDVDNPNITIYNNSGKAFKWIYAINGSDTSTTFVTGTVPSYTDNNGNVYYEVLVKTGTP